MDAALLTMMRSGGRNKDWAEMMVNMEARKLINTANTVSSFHLRDGLTRIKFMEDIKSFINQQFSVARQAKSDEECIKCIHNMREENNNLLEQSRLLKMKTARLFAKVEFIKENNRIVGYVISAVNVVMSGLAIAGGVALFGTMNPLGMLAGATLVMDGVNGISREINHTFLGNQNSQGAIADGAMSAAAFMGFKKEVGLAVYKSVSLAANVYGVFGLLRKPGTWRLFHYIPQDFYRNVSSMSRPKLTMKIVGYGLNAKIIFDLLTVDNTTR
ncbi:DUF4225 domain-containing protein [Erwinia psidii]|uniref:DUF4225 domain-containing protein n=1 Tax=Erwinia psidii TaxID=69224 RepID=UPI00226B9448|nr:DUF4225 domain-containing protein [Erwinia psidii]MCX8967418.1 DUF4225 domain-containing protein [Erwinia psidii]